MIAHPLIRLPRCCKIYCSRKQTFYSLFLEKKCQSRPLFLYFRLFNSVDSKRSIYFLPMTGFELRTSGVGSKHSTNWAPTLYLRTVFTKYSFFEFTLTFKLHICSMFMTIPTILCYKANPTYSISTSLWTLVQGNLGVYILPKTIKFAFRKFLKEAGDVIYGLTTYRD